MNTRDTEAVGRLIDTTIEVERQYVVAGWFDPGHLYAAVGEHGIFGNRFADRVCGFLHAFIVTCHEWGVQPNVDLAEAVAEEHGDVDVTAREILAMLVTTDYESAELDAYAFGVALFSERRERAAYHWAEYQRLVRDDDQIADDAVQVGRNTLVPKHLSRKKRGGRRARTTV